MARIELELKEVCISKTKCRYVPHSPNTLKTKHWAARSRWTEGWKEEVFYAFRNHPDYLKVKKEIPFENSIVLITYYTCYPMDRDNLYASAKPIIDGLRVPKKNETIGAGIIDDDTEDDITLKVVQQKIGTKKDQHVHIAVWTPDNELSEEEKLEMLATAE